MQILQINLERGWRGGERQTLLTACAQRELGHDVEIIARAGSELAQHARELGFTVHHARQAVSLALWLSLHGARFDILHAQTAGAVTGTVLAKPFHRRPIVFSRRTEFPVSSGQLFTKLKWKCVDQLVAISQAAAAEPRRFGLAPIIIPSATPPITPDTHRINTLISTHQLQGKRLIGTSAALSVEKDPLTLIQAAALVCQDHQDVVFIHWGADGSSSEASRALIKKLGIEKKYLLLGFQHSPERLYPALSAFVLCSTYEALGSSLLDAMSLEIPVVGTRTGGIKEVLADGRGLLATVGDAQEIAKHLDWVLSHPAEVSNMTALAAQYVRNEHDVSRMAQKYLALYTHLSR
ncbi:glycosyltransferase family 4 protein [Zwartia panacis]|uniref:glycosyltransferase family 4 protein n=1 Tax=Zwartia panacis TaxID=2683345 RepID=UPI0025B37FFB|nr:glycosyltransferase family 4 protein [Zwartia panacis]MDN4016099.1 glycosyltransferase family 4 protein [Zwartia panacis]